MGYRDQWPDEINGTAKGNRSDRDRRERASAPKEGDRRIRPDGVRVEYSGPIGGWMAVHGDDNMTDAQWLNYGKKPPAPATERDSTFFSASSLKGKPVPPREWLVHGMVPQRTVTLFAGDGGTGKSLLALQLGVASAAGTAWLGKSVKQGRVIFISAEDDEDELHRRLDDILAAEGRTYDEVEGLTLRSLAGEDALLAIEGQLSLIESELFKELESRAEQEDPALIVIDTLADVYPANENDRAKVRQFVGILRGLAIRQKCAVMLLGHPSLTGLNSGSGTSGSTAWHNSVRSRLYMSRIIEDNYEPDTVSEAGGSTSTTVLAAEVLHLRIGVDPVAPWTGQAPLRRASLTASLLHEIETALRDTWRDAPVGSQIAHMPEGSASDMAAMRSAFKGRRGSTLVVEGVAQAVGAGMHPNSGKAPDQLTPDLQRAMPAELLDAARGAIFAAYGVLARDVLTCGSGASCARGAAPPCPNRHAAPCDALSRGSFGKAGRGGQDRLCSRDAGI